MRLIGRALRPGRVSGTVAHPVTATRASPGIAIVPQSGATQSRSEIVGWVVEGEGLPEGLVGFEGPVVGQLDSDLFRDGEPVTVDGTSGWAELPTVPAAPVVTAFLERPDGRILLLHRSEQVGSFRGAWAAVSGYLEDPTPEAQARREVLEETGIPAEACRLAASAEPIYARGTDRIFVVHPFRFEVSDPPVRLDWEHTEFEWVPPGELGRRSTVPKLDRAWAAVAPGSNPGRPDGRSTQ
jgi:8-oxo-dGTP diphosphatase